MNRRWAVETSGLLNFGHSRVDEAAGAHSCDTTRHVDGFFKPWHSSGGETWGEEASGRVAADPTPRRYLLHHIPRKDPKTRPNLDTPMARDSPAEISDLRLVHLAIDPRLTCCFTPQGSLALLCKVLKTDPFIIYHTMGPYIPCDIYIYIYI